MSAGVQTITPPEVGRPLRLVAGPERVKNELVWQVEVDGAPALLAQLLPELADEEALRRRYAYELERLASRRAPRLARILAVGPAPDPRDPTAPPPWRLRADPPGTLLEHYLAERAPLPIDDAIALAADLAEAVGAAHDEGWVVRDLEPRSVVLDAGDGRPWLTDVGLARLHILTTLTASSLMLASTAYAAPEHVRATLVDPRADVYSVGAVLWRALTGVLPFGDRHALLRDHASLPPLGDLVPEAPPQLEALLAACLAEDPASRPENGRELAELLRGEGEPRPLSLTRVACQACGAPMRPGLRLCLACGKEAVQFRHRERGGYRVFLRRAKEDASFHAELSAYLEELGEKPEHLDFVIGNPRMYGKAELARRHRLPAPLFVDLDRDTARKLAERLRARGLSARVRRLRTIAGGRSTGLGLLFGGFVTIGAAIAGIGTIAVMGGLLAAGFGAIVIGGRMLTNATLAARPPVARLRAAPAALPASDPLVARLAALLGPKTAADVREQIGELALGVQHLVDRRAELHDTAELDAVTEPIVPLLGHVEQCAGAIADIDAALADLDEGGLVRALAASEARREPREKRAELLSALDRLRALEDRRTAYMERLLDASSLLRRAVDLGLAQQDDRRLDAAFERLALADLDED